MLDKLEAINARFEDLGVALSNPAIVSDNRKFSAMSKEYRSVEKIVNAYEAYKKLLDDIVVHLWQIFDQDYLPQFLVIVPNCPTATTSH